MAKGFYVTIIRDRRVGWLRGPFVTHDEALAVVDETRLEACRLDPRAEFDLFGTSSREGENLGPGVLNGKMCTNI